MLKKLRNLMRKKRVRIGLTALILAAVAMGVYAAAQLGASVPVTTVVYEKVEESFFEDGMVRAQNRAVVSADVSGKVLSVLVREGQAVNAGDVLCTIDTADLQTNLAQLEAQRDGILAAWAQSEDEVGMQIAALKTQRAGYYSKEQRASLTAQMDMLTASLDVTNPDSVAGSYEQLLRLTDERIAFTQWQLGRALSSVPPAVDALQNQLNAAQIQLETFENQRAQTEAQLSTQILDYEKKMLEAIDAAVDPDSDPTVIYWDSMIKAANEAGILSSYDQLIRSADTQADDLYAQLNRAARETPESADALNAQFLGLQGEREALEEQWRTYERQARAQILALQAQQASEKSIRQNVDAQIGLLEESADEGSSTAEYYAAQIRQVDANIEDITRKMELAAVRAPISGVVGAIDLLSGQVVQQGAQITELVDPNSLEIECMLLTGDAGSVQKDMPVSIIWERKDGDVSFEGRVTRISALAVNSLSAVGLNEQRVKVVLTPVFTDDAHPMDGYQVRVRFTLASATALTVPKAAVVETDRGDAVFLLADGRAVLTPIETGLESGGRVEVIKGLTIDDALISEPEGLDDGARARPAE